MLLFWLVLALIIGLGEILKDGYDASQYKKSGGLESKYPNTFGKK